jgi:plastocyanin
MRRLALLPALVAVLTLAACSSGASSAPAASTAVSAAPSTAAGGASAPAGGGALACAAAPAGATAAQTVTIKDFKYAPQPVQAKVGDVVAWSNQDGNTPHSATMDDGSCDTQPIAGGATAALVFNAPGTYTYHCSVHPTQMKDFTVVVQ